ncbi:MAG: HAD family hydrolase [Actinobacteria bacterium]|nr:HAD family hydrolase [Actinomycetota bacterium]
MGPARGRRATSALDEPARLVLFDIDGTLFLTSDPLVGRATLDAIEEVWGLRLPPDAIGKVDHPGQTAQRITRLVLEAAGVDDEQIDAGLTRWCVLVSDRYLGLLAESDTSHWQAAPGAAETLEELSRRTRIVLMTGNPEPIARARMERLGLARFFQEGQGAFGCDAEDRVDLIRDARERAGGVPADQTWAVGDTPRDVEGAHAAGIHCVGITLGRFDRDDLRDADAIVGRFTDLLGALVLV